MRTIYKRLAAAAMSVIAVASVAACSDGSSTDSASDEKKIGYMIWNTSVPFYSNLIAKAEETAKSMGVSLDIQSGNGDLATEIAVVQQFISQRVSMILISPSDPKGIVPVILQANAANIPVMAVNTEADTSSGAKVVTYVGVNDVEFGEHQGELLVKALGGKGDVGYITGKLGTSAQINREQGFMSVIKKNPGIKIVARQAADWDNAKALAVTQDMLSKYPAGKLSAIVGQGPENVTGAKYAYQNGRRDVTFVVGDYPVDVRNAVQAGEVYGTVDQDPAPQGVNAIKYAVDWLAGNTSAVPQPQAYITMPVITKENVSEYPAAWGE
jgi:ribose transport system substrate-binding protein